MESITQPLGDIVDIHSGYLLKKIEKIKPAMDAFVIQPRDVSEDGRVLNPSHSTPIPSDPQQVHYLKESDVLFLSKMNPRAAWVGADLEHANTIASSHFFIIRPTSKVIQPSYLFWFLNQQETRKFIRSVAAGSSILNVKKSDLQELQIPLPSIQMQQKIAELAFLTNRYRELQQMIVDKTDRLVEQITHKALNKQMRK